MIYASNWLFFSSFSKIFQAFKTLFPAVRFLYDSFNNEYQITPFYSPRYLVLAL